MKRFLSWLLVFVLIAAPMPVAARDAAAAQASGGGVIPEPYTLTYPQDFPDSGYPILHAAASDTTYISPYAAGVRNQASNGICWTFAATAAIEANMKINGVSPDPDLSELHMAHALSNSSGNSQGFKRTPDDGGHRGMSSAYLMRGEKLNGTVAEAADPYASYLGGAKIQPRSLPTTENIDKNYTVQNILFLNGNGDSRTNDSTAIKNAILTYGAVACSMYWDGNAISGDGDVTYYNASKGAYYYDGSANTTNHAVTLVGWDNNYSKTNFNNGHQPTNNGAWLVKNSWGQNWGVDVNSGINGECGYFWLSYEDKRAPFTAWVIDGVEAYDPDSEVLEYDYLGHIGSMDYRPTTFSTLYGANVFDNTSDKKLEEVRFFLPDASTTVNIYVVPNYTGTSSLNITSATQKIMVNQSFTYPGWYTWDAGQIDTGPKFAVILQYTVSGSARVPIECSYDGFNVPVTSGVSFMAYNTAATWSPVNDGDINIKAVVKASLPATDSEAVERVKNSLTWNTIRLSNITQTNVRTNLNLITSGLYGSTIDWTSSDPDVISNSGVVTRPPEGSPNADVTLTATITKGSEDDTVTFNLTVPAVGNDPVGDGVIIPSTTADDAYINLTAETIDLDGFTVKAYSVDGGKKWKKGQLPTDPVKFSKLFDRALELQVADTWNDKAVKLGRVVIIPKGVPEDALKIKFPKINARPKANTEKLKPYYDSETWTPKDKNGVDPLKFYAWSNVDARKKQTGDWYPLENGFAIQTGRTKTTFMFRVPAYAEPAADGIAYFPNSKMFKLTPANFGKAPNYAVKTDRTGKRIVKMKAGDRYQLGNGAPVTVTRETAVLDVTVTTGTLTVWKGETGKKPRSEKQIITL